MFTFSLIVQQAQSFLWPSEWTPYQLELWSIGRLGSGDREDGQREGVDGSHNIPSCTHVLCGINLIMHQGWGARYYALRESVHRSILAWVTMDLPYYDAGVRKLQVCASAIRITNTATSAGRPGNLGCILSMLRKKNQVNVPCCTFKFQFVWGHDTG